MATDGAERALGPSKQKANLATVAASAGVSIATVSKVVNGRTDVGPETRARVQSLLDEHNYVGRRADRAQADRAQADGPNANKIIELVFHGEQTGYALAVMGGVLEAGADAGVTVAISQRSRERVAKEKSAEWVRSLAARGRTAVIDVVDDVRRGDLAAFARSKLPLVVLDPLSLPNRDVPSIGTTNFSGGLTATQHLLSLGHTKIAYLGAAGDFVFNQARSHGFRAAMEAAGLAVRPEYVINGEYDYDAGVQGGGALLDLDDPPSAIFAATDESAAGVIEAARLRGLRVPEDLSLVGFDDAPLARLLSPPLTTVRQPLREMGQLALKTALRLAAGEKLDSHHVELATELVVRSSTAAVSIS